MRVPQKGDDRYQRELTRNAKQARKVRREQLRTAAPELYAACKAMLASEPNAWNLMYAVVDKLDGTEEKP